MLIYLKNNPILSAFIIFIIALLLRLNDIFILRIDERWGEIIISKVLGFVLILIFMFIIKKSITTIGFHKKHLLFCISLGFLVNLAVYLISYTIEYFILILNHQNPHLLIYAIDPKQNVNGGFIFGIWLVIGNIINALMEEGLLYYIFNLLTVLIL